jgi:hypothetical protein
MDLRPGSGPPRPFYAGRSAGATLPSHSRSSSRARCGGSVRITKSRKDCAQIVANRDSELGYAFAVAGYALLLDALLPFVSPAHRGRMPYCSLLAATLAQRAHFGRLLGPQKHQRSALSLAVNALAQPGVHLGRFLGPQEQRRSALSHSVKSAVPRIVL